MPANAASIDRPALARHESTPDLPATEIQLKAQRIVDVVYSASDEQKEVQLKIDELMQSKELMKQSNGVAGELAESMARVDHEISVCQNSIEIIGARATDALMEAVQVHTDLSAEHKAEQHSKLNENLKTVAEIRASPEVREALKTIHTLFYLEQKQHEELAPWLSKLGFYSLISDDAPALNKLEQSADNPLLKKIKTVINANRSVLESSGQTVPKARQLFGDDIPLLTKVK